MKARLAALLSLLSLLLVATPAFARRQTVPARATATVRASADDSADSVATVKKGDMLTILGAKGDWSNVQTKNGKQGWVKSSVVSDKKASFDSMGTSTTTVAAAEGSTEGAIRGKGVKRKTMVVGTGGVPLATVKAVADQVAKIPQVTVIDRHAEKKVMPTSAAGGLDGAHQLADAKKADLVVAVSPGTNQELRYEIVDLKKGIVLATGTTSSTDDAKKSATELGTTVEHALLAPAPAASPEASPAATAAAAETPAAAATAAASDDCVKKCMDRSQMKAESIDAIKADCEKSCAK